MPLFHRKTDHNALISPLLLSVVFGLAAGAVGTLLIAASAPNPGPLFSPVQTVNRVPGAAGESGFVSATSASPSALVFRAKAASASPLDQTFVPAQAIGSAAVLTSDGWLLSTDTVFTEAVRSSLASYRVTVGRSAYRIVETVLDPFTGIVFLKVDGRNLPIVSYSEGDDLQPGSTAFGFDVAGGPRRLDVIGYGPRPASAPADLVRSSERVQRVLRLSGSGGSVPAGSMVVDASGEAVAIFLSDDASGSTAVPFSAFSGQIGSILRDRKAHRPYFGVRYADATHLLGVDAVGPDMNGALLMASSDGRPAVQRRSPAEAAGLRAGDRIVGVNEEALGTQTALADLLAEYPPGSVVTIRARRESASGGTDVVVTATLGEAP